MRRLPIFLVVDVSESMVGENHRQMEAGIEMIVKTLRTDPYALETAFLSIIAFAGKVKIISPLVEISSFIPPRLPIGGGTSLGLALGTLMDEIDNNVTTSNHERKGDWKSIVFLFTDGKPTDETSSSIKRWNDSYRTKANLVALSIGPDADMEVLKSLTDDVLILSDTSSEGFARFVNWVSRSIQNQSRSVSTGKDARISLDKTEKDLIVEVNEGNLAKVARVDERFAVFTGRCARTTNPYLLKYKLATDMEKRRPIHDANSNTGSYSLEAALPLDYSFFELTSDDNLSSTISSTRLTEVPVCPHCEALSALAVCGCGKIHCIGNTDSEVCPWCGNKGLYAVSDLDIQRGLG